MSITEFLNLGRQPIANNFIKNGEKELFFNLGASFNDETNLVSLSNFVDKNKLFHDQYAYSSSMSITMKKHFKQIAEIIKKFNPSKILEIGSNDGAFLFNFSPKKAIAVEPCGNFSNLLKKAGYISYTRFWDLNLVNEILSKYGKMDIIYAANCMCHIPEIEESLLAVKNLLNDNGILIFEDPSLEEMIKRGSYDQIYDEHAHIFSILSLNKLLNNNNLEIRKIEKLSVHGGSNRIYATLNKNNFLKKDNSVDKFIKNEELNGLNKLNTFIEFSNKIKKSKIDLISLLDSIKDKNIIGYGATSKSVVVYNYCKIKDNYINYVVDTTPSKQNKLIPGVHIPIIKYTKIKNNINYAFLGAWNYEKEILKKEQDFIKRGGRFITHVPYVRII